MKSKARPFAPKYSLNPSQIVTTFGSYATAPSVSVLIAAPASEQREAAAGLPDEVVELVGRRRHDARRLRVAEDALDADLLAIRRAAADAHAELRHLERRLSRGGLAFEDAQHRVLASPFRGLDRVGHERLRHV